MSAGLTTGEVSRVFMTTDAVGGVWSYALELAAGFSRRGISTDLAILGPVTPAALAEAARRPGVCVHATGLPLDWTADSASALAAASRALADVAARCCPDVVHLNAPALAAVSPFPAPTVVVAHSCVATWWQAVRRGALPADFAWRTALTARGLRAAGAIIAPSASFAAAVRDTYGADLEVIAVRNGRAPAARTRPPARQDCVLTAGRLWDEGKNVAALDRAAKQLASPFYAAGPLSGPNGAAIRLSHLRPLGQLDASALASWYATAPIFATATRYEPFGLTALEAASSGAALVLSDIPTFRELWDGAAVFVADDDQFAPALQRLLDAPQIRAKLADEAAARAARYTADAMIEQTLSVYRRLLARARVAA